MPLYKKVVVAIDPLIDSDEIISKAKQLAGNNNALDLIYVWDEIPIAFQGSPLAVPMGYTSETHEQKAEVQNTLTKLAEKHGFNEQHTHILTGSPAKEIRNFAKEHQADCIVMGSHGRHGIALLLGSTASSVVHGTPCDILVIKI